MQLLRKKRGELSRIAEAVGVSKQAVHQWRVIPPDHVSAVARVTGMKREELRPDWFKPIEAAE
jgi:DNA-binding transcriptional regulator YdaS (Cro superfamily)